MEAGGWQGARTGPLQGFTYVYVKRTWTGAYKYLDVTSSVSTSIMRGSCAAVENLWRLLPRGENLNLAPGSLMESMLAVRYI